MVVGSRSCPDLRRVNQGNIDDLDGPDIVLREFLKLLLKGTRVPSMYRGDAFRAKLASGDELAAWEGAERSRAEHRPRTAPRAGLGYRICDIAG